MYNKVPTDLNFVAREKEVEKFWEDHEIFQKSIDNRKKAETYTFYDGPPTANGKPHIGHVLTRVIKDMIPTCRERPDGIPTDFQSNWKWRRCWGWTARSRSRNTVSSHLSSTARKVYGSTRACGRISPRPSASGLIWMIRTLPMRTTISSPSGGL